MQTVYFSRIIFQKLGNLKLSTSQCFWRQRTQMDQFDRKVINMISKWCDSHWFLSTTLVSHGQMVTLTLTVSFWSRKMGCTLKETPSCVHGSCSRKETFCSDGDIAAVLASAWRPRPATSVTWDRLDWSTRVSVLSVPAVSCPGIFLPCRGTRWLWSCVPPLYPTPEPWKEGRWVLDSIV